MAGEKILVVEDNEANMLLATSALQADGYVPLKAKTAEEGISIAKHEQPSLILMDISLPGMDGLTATGILRNDPSTCTIPIVALTAHAMKGDEEKALAAGCAGYMSKPIRIRAFSETVARFVCTQAEVHTR